MGVPAGRTPWPEKHSAESRSAEHAGGFRQCEGYLCDWNAASRGEGKRD